MSLGLFTLKEELDYEKSILRAMESRYRNDGRLWDKLMAQRGFVRGLKYAYLLLTEKR